MNEVSATLPPGVKIGGFVYTFSRLRTTDSRARWAETDKNEKEIHFGELTRGVHMPNALIHEFLHAVWQEYGLKDQYTDDEERIVSCLANGLHQVLTDLGWLPQDLKLTGEE